MEAEGLTRVLSGVCDCAHVGRVVREVSIATLQIKGCLRVRGSSENYFSQRPRGMLVRDFVKILRNNPDCHKQ